MTAQEVGSWLESASHTDVVAVLAAALGRLAKPAPLMRKGEDHQRWLSPLEAASISGLKRSWFYEHSDLPFMSRPSPRRLVVQQAGLFRYLQERTNGGRLQ
jgi:hypothetical protein